MPDTTLETYLKVKTGQDLINLGVVPKDSSSHLGLIAKLRLEGLRDRVLTGINDEMMGAWKPAIYREQKTLVEVTTINDIKQYAKEGVKVRGVGQQDGKHFEGIEGVIKRVYDNRELGIEWSKQIDGGNDLRGLCEFGRGYRVTPDVVQLLEVVLEEKYTLATGVVADKQLGHKVKFNKKYTGSMSEDGGRVEFEIPQGAIATITSYNEAKGVIGIKVKDKINKRENFVVELKTGYGCLEVSSLGQVEPMNKEEEVKKQTYSEFFPTTVLEPARAERVLKALMMSKDLVLYGPPGGGKSNTAKDIISIAKSQGVIFEVDNKHCRSNCNPFSVFDAEFGEAVPPCPDCKEKYDPEFRKTGRFNRPKASDVGVIAARYGSGNGILFVEGTVSVNRMHLAGYAIPRMDQGMNTIMLQILKQGGMLKDSVMAATDDGKDYDFHPGVLILSNNGILHLDEMDKLRPQALDEFLEALNSQRVQPEGLIYPYPANSLIVGTANDNSKFSSALNDRMLLLAIRYSEDRDVSYEITRKGYYKEFTDLKAITLPDTHKMKGLGLRAIPMPVIVERAVDAFYMKLRNEYTGAGKNEVSGSNRCKFDALDGARAQLLIDQIFYTGTPQIATAKYAVSGLQYAICARVQETSREVGQKAKGEINEWVEQTFPALLKEEEGTWWCRVYKDMALAKSIIPEVGGNFMREQKEYEEDVRNASRGFAKVQRAYTNPTDKAAQMAKIEYPFMNNLFTNQPGFATVNETQLHQLVDYFLKSKANSPCQMSATP